MWGLAIAVAMIGTFALIGTNVFDAQETVYLNQKWTPHASIVGGLVFGYGMALAGNCGFGTIARLGGGDLRSFVIVLVMGVSAYVVLTGPLAPLRLALFNKSIIGPAVPPQGLAHSLAGLTGIPVAWVGISVGVALAAFVLSSKRFLKEYNAIVWSAVVGIAVVSGWAGTAWVAHNGFEGVGLKSHTFAEPVGDAILYAMSGSARNLSFGIGSVSGVWIGAFIGSLIKGHFRWEACEDPRELRRQILGAGLMGAGAVVAVGCTVGQGITAFSLLAYSAPVTFVSIFAGAAFGLRQLITGFRVVV